MNVAARYRYKQYQRSEAWERQPRGLPFILDATGYCYKDTPWTNAQRVRRLPDIDPAVPNVQLWEVHRYRRKPIYILFHRLTEHWEVHASWPPATKEPRCTTP